MIEIKSDYIGRAKKHLRIIILVTIALMLTMFFAFYIGARTVVAIELDGKKYEVKTHASTVQALLTELEVDYKEQDYLNVPIDSKIEKDLVLEWKPAYEIALFIDGNKSSSWTTADTIADFLDEESIVLKEEDDVSVALSDEIDEDMKIEIDVAFPVLIADAEKETELYITQMAVADLLFEQGITLNRLDRVEPGLGVELVEATTIEVVRVETELVKKKSDIEFKTIRTEDDSLLKGTKEVVTKGKNGTLVTTYEITRENGEIVSEEVIDEVTKKEPVDREIKVGTKEKPKEPEVKLETKSKAESKTKPTGGKTFSVQATAYTFNTGRASITATGFNLDRNPDAKVIAVDPSVIPLGTKVYVEGYGHATALDTGGKIKGNVIDVFLPTRAAALQWGRKTVNVTIL